MEEINLDTGLGCLVKAAKKVITGGKHTPNYYMAKNGGEFAKNYMILSLDCFGDNS